jgi:hypothetical protein
LRPSTEEAYNQFTWKQDYSNWKLCTEVLKSSTEILNARKTQVQNAVCTTLWSYQRKYTAPLISKKNPTSNLLRDKNLKLLDDAVGHQ